MNFQAFSYFVYSTLKILHFEHEKIWLARNASSKSVCGFRTRICH